MTELQEAFGFKVGQEVTTLCECSGDDWEDNEQVVPAGANGTISYIQRFDNEQGIAFTVMVDVGKIDSEGDALTIVNVFDEGDGDIRQFIKARD